jgi:hypothetical protein
VLDAAVHCPHCSNRTGHTPSFAINSGVVQARRAELGLVDELRMFRYPVVVGGGTPFLPPVTEDVPLGLIETRTFGSRVIYERYRRAPR